MWPWADPNLYLPVFLSSIWECCHMPNMQIRWIFKRFKKEHLKVDLEAVREKGRIWNDLFISLACFQRTNFFGSVYPPDYSGSYISSIHTPFCPSRADFYLGRKANIWVLNNFDSPKPPPVSSSLFSLLPVFMLTPACFPRLHPKKYTCPIKNL